MAQGFSCKKKLGVIREGKIWVEIVINQRKKLKIMLSLVYKLYSSHTVNGCHLTARQLEHAKNFLDECDKTFSFTLYVY